MPYVENFRKSLIEPKDSMGKNRFLGIDSEGNMSPSFKDIENRRAFSFEPATKKAHRPLTCSSANTMQH